MGPAERRGGAPPAKARAGTSLCAVVDLGSRELRMAVGELRRERQVRRLETLNVPVALGLDTFSSGRIRSATTEAVISTLRDFLSITAGYGIEPATIRAVATTAVRDARNRAVFLDRLEQGSGLRVEVIEAIEETRLIYQFIRHLIGPRFDQGTCMLLSLGAGGTQIIVQERGEIVFGETRHFGLLQLWGHHLTERSAILAARTFLRKEIRSIQRLQDLLSIDSLIVINKELHRLLEELATAERSDVGLELPRAELARLHASLDRPGSKEALQQQGLDYTTAEMGLMALEELKAFSEQTSAPVITVPGSSLLDCLLLDAWLRREGESGSEQLARQIESSALALGRKYRFDEAHALHVRELALQLFAALRRHIHLAERSGLLLSVAAILHDIGYYVNPHAHEQHSSYLIAASEIIGLTRRDLGLIALIARLHRRAYADFDRSELGRLPVAEGVELLKLAALLRLADALDDDYLQRVQRVEVEMDGDRLRVFAETRTGDREAFATIAQSFTKKADCFAEIFGIDPVLTEVIAR